MAITKSEVELLISYVVDNAGSHEEDCPGDDTCECKWKPRNDAVNKICSELNTAKAAVSDDIEIRILPFLKISNQKKIDHAAATLTKEMALVTGFSRDRLCLLQSRIHKILSEEFKNV